MSLKPYKTNYAVDLTVRRWSEVDVPNSVTKVLFRTFGRVLRAELLDVRWPTNSAVHDPVGGVANFDPELPALQDFLRSGKL